MTRNETCGHSTSFTWTINRFLWFAKCVCWWLFGLGGQFTWKRANAVRTVGILRTGSRPASGFVCLMFLYTVKTGSVCRMCGVSRAEKRFLSFQEFPLHSVCRIIEKTTTFVLSFKPEIHFQSFTRIPTEIPHHIVCVSLSWLVEQCQPIRVDLLMENYRLPLYLYYSLSDWDAHTHWPRSGLLLQAWCSHSGGVGAGQPGGDFRTLSVTMAGPQQSPCSRDVLALTHPVPLPSVQPDNRLPRSCTCQPCLEATKTVGEWLRQASTCLIGTVPGYRLPVWQ